MQQSQMCKCPDSEQQTLACTTRALSAQAEQEQEHPDNKQNSTQQLFTLPSTNLDTNLGADVDAHPDAI